MRDGYIPPDLEALLRRADAAFDPFRDRLAQARRLPLPEIEPPDPEQLRAAAARPDAPDELKAVARAIRDGRTTWADLLAGRSDHLPEVAAFYRVAGEQVARAARGESTDPTPSKRPARPKPVDEDEDEPPQSFMRRGW